MGIKIAAAVFGLLLILFFLSVIAPMQSQKRFWIAIHRIRAVIDLVVYWFFNVCAVLSLSYLVCSTLLGLLKS